VWQVHEERVPILLEPSSLALREALSAKAVWQLGELIAVPYDLAVE
jgi:hypothetical protein